MHLFCPKRSGLLIFQVFAIFILFTSVEAVSQENNPLINSGELIKKGIDLHEQGKYKEAIDVYVQIPRSDTNYSTALYELSFSAYSNGQADSAKRYAETGLKLFPDRADEFYLQIANSLDYLGKPEEALSVYEKAITLYPNQYNLYFNEGLALRTLKRTEEAKAAFQKCLLINSIQPSSHYYLGEIYLKEGNLIPAMLAFQTYLLASPSGRYLKNSVDYLTAISKVTDEVLGYTRSRTGKISPDFELIQEIVLSKISHDKQYQLMVKLEDVIVRQMQVVLEKLEYNKNNKDFAMQFYVPFYSRIMKDKMFEPLVYDIFSGLKVETIQNWLKKNKSDLDAFKTYASAYFMEIKNTRVLDAEERKNTKIKYSYSDATLIGKGRYSNEEKQVEEGEWEYYYGNTALKAKGVFDTDGKRNGEWKFYYPDGSIEEISHYDHGQTNGLTDGWFKNGNLNYHENYSKDLLEGVSKVYYYNGNIKSELFYKSGKKNGEVRDYYNSGLLQSVENYIDGKKEGASTNYFQNGMIESTWSYKNDQGTGPYKRFAKNGKVTLEGNTVENEKDGVWIEYFESGKLKDKTTYVKGDATGEYFQYHDNGSLSEKGNYIKSKIDGKVESYDEDGKKSSDYVYEKGRLKEVNFFDKSGKVISSTGTRRGAATIVYYDPYGIKTSEGYFNRDGNRDGPFTFYYPSGKVSAIENYKDGKLEGKAINYYLNGDIKSESNYSANVKDGYIKNYFEGSKVSYEGWMKNDQKQGMYISSDPFGNITANENYLDDELNNYTQYLYPGNITDYESKYHNGWLEQINQYDSTGKVIAENYFKKGSGPMIFRHYSGKNMIEGTYKNYAREGAYKTFFFDGSTESVSYFKHGDFDSIYRYYSYEGKLSVMGNYKDGEKAGVWKYYFDDGKLKEEENYENGKLNGEDKVYNVDGTFDKIITYKDGETITYRIYTGKNNLAVQINYSDELIKSYSYENKDGKLTEPVILEKGSGKIAGFYPNGIKSAEIDVTDGYFNGARKIYFNTGKLHIDGLKIENYDDGLKKVYFADGTLNTEESFVNRNQHGLSKTWYPSGKIQMIQNYYNGNLHGNSSYYDEQGKLKQTRIYYYNNLLNAK